MYPKKAALIIILFLGVAAIAAQTERKPLLSDGFVLDNIEGKIISADSNDVWFFELAVDVNDNSNVLKAGTKLELLPSSGLEGMINDLKIHPPATYRINKGTITRYKGNNYIFLSDFTPLVPRKIQSQTDKPSPVEQPEQQPDVEDSDNLIDIPPEIREKINAAGAQQSNTITRRTQDLTDPNQNQQPQDANDYVQYIDNVVVDRTAVLVEHNKGGFAFSLNSLGRNLPETSLRLLPCEVLEQTEQIKNSEPERVRFNICGIKTKYKNEYYLLPQKATRLYNHGNFGG